MANQFTANGFPVKPSVDIEGFPFLTQVLHKDFKKVVISASNIPAGPVTISSLNATITGMHLNSSWNGATIDHVTATAFVSLSSLTGGISSELGDAASLTAVPDGANKLKVTGTVLGGLSASGVVEFKQTGPQKITVELPTSGGLVGTLLGSAPSFTITLPAGVPPSLRITGLTLNGQGLTLSAAATNATFSQ
jgi:LmeA-like phospholipid-binding